MAESKYEAFIHPREAELLVIGATVLGAITLFAGLFLQMPFLVLVTIASFGVAIYQYPKINNRKPMIVADSRGLAIDGLGRFEWQAIRSLHLDVPSETSGGTYRLVVHLAEEVEAYFHPQEEETALRSVQTRIWRHEEENRLSVLLDGFRETPLEISDAIRAHHDAGTA